MAFTDNKATGSMKVSGQDRPIAAELGGPIFPEAVAVPVAIACLPLAEGYTTSFRNFDVQKQKAKAMKLEVTGSEKVTVPAGTFDTFKVEITPADGGAEKNTVWIAKETRRAVKISAVVPEMGGAVMTAELSE